MAAQDGDGLDESDQLNDQFFKEVMQRKATEPGMFVSNWEDDDSGIVPESEPGSNKAKILKAAENGDYQSVQELLTIDPSLVWSTDSDGYTPLHRASYNDHANVVELLLRRGANIGARTECGWQPIHSAAKWGSANALRVLVSLGAADVNARTNGNLTPLHLAAACKEPGGVDTARLLIAHPNIQLDAVSNAGETPGAIARQTSREMLELFEQKAQEGPKMEVAEPMDI